MKKTRLIPNAKVLLLLLPVFALLTACGGGDYNDPAFDAPAEMLASKPANYMPEAATVVESDTAGAADAAIAADAAARAAAPAEAPAPEAASSQTAQSSTVPFSSTAPASPAAAVSDAAAPGAVAHAVVIIAPPVEARTKRNTVHSGITVLTAPSVNPVQAQATQAVPTAVPGTAQMPR